MSNEAPKKLTRRERSALERANAPALVALKAKKAEVDRRNRRLVLGGIILGTAAVAVGTADFLIRNQTQEPEMPKGDSLLTHQIPLRRGPEIAFPTNRNVYQFSDPVSPKSNIDRGYLSDLLAQLQEETSNNEEPPASVINRLSLVASIGQGAGLTNSLMLDESGIFLTCGHTFVKIDSNSNNPSADSSKFKFKSIGLPAKAVFPALRKRFQVTQYVALPTKDLALFYAPTGYRRKRVEGIQIKTDALKQGEDLWQPSLVAQEDALNFQIAGGSVVSPEKNLKINTRSAFTDLVGVVDMIPFGGSSGSPIIDGLGRIVGVESGFFEREGVSMSERITRADYAGSTIAPLLSLRDLVANGEIVTLPK